MKLLSTCLLYTSYSEATGYTLVELETNKRPTRFWSRNIDKSPNQNLEIPLSHKYDNPKKRMEKLGEKRIERFNKRTNSSHSMKEK